MSFVWLAILAALLGSAAWLASTLSGTPLVGYDDANIVFVYARNLIDGHGFVFNAGGERVEGFTSLLWLLICAVARVITPRFELLLFAINVVLVSVALWWLHRFISEILRSAVLGLLLTLLVALTPGFVVWNVVSLMDSGLWTAVFVIAAVTVLRSAFEPADARILPILLVALALTRPESLLLGPALIAVSMLIRPSLETHVASIAAFAATAATLVIWRLTYFGYPFPNSYYARAGESLVAQIAAGFDYFSDFAIANPLVPLALIAAVITTARAPSRAQAGLLALMVAGCAVPIIAGGDRFGFWRMFQPVAPLAAIQVAFTAKLLATTERRAVTYVVAVLLALVPWRHWAVLDNLDYASAVAPTGSWYTPKVEISIADDMRTIGAGFTRAFPDVKPSVGVIVAGGFAFAYDGPTIDLLGHNHAVMAHAPGHRIGPHSQAAFQPELFTALKPDAVLLSRWSPERDWFAFPMMAGDYDRPAHLTPDYFSKRAASMRIFDYGVMKGLLLKSQAGQDYAWASVRRPGAARWIHAVFNREFLKELAGRGYEVVFATPLK
ncbi:MAG TPA: hypothetical protein VJ691_06735 [Vicinamibacterales bacterium]|nr:hypothetical protein [Vicinamibacterales bacterium]